jgi:hypothetical protein
MSRSAFVVQPNILRNVNGNILVGISSADNVKRLLAGCNASRIVNGLLKIGGELEYNYFGRSDLHESALLLFRAHPNVCVQVSPGYIQSSATSFWMISIGVSFSTSGIELVSAEKPTDKQNVLPSIEDLEKQLREEKKKE